MHFKKITGLEVDRVNPWSLRELIWAWVREVQTLDLDQAIEAHERSWKIKEGQIKEGQRRFYARCKNNGEVEVFESGVIGGGG